MGLQHSPRIVTDGLVLCLDAADKNSYPGSGTTWTDLSGQGNNGTLTNMSATPLDSGNGGSLVFDGVNDYINTNLFFDKQDFTYSAWVNFSNTPTSGWADIIDSFESSSSEWARLGLLNGEFIFICDNNSVRKDAVGSSASTGVWYYVVGTRNGSNMKLYLNGIVDATQTQSELSIIQGINAERIGAQSTSGSENFNGKISKVAIYNRALTPQEVQQNYNATKTRFGL